MQWTTKVVSQDTVSLRFGPNNLYLVTNTKKKLHSKKNSRETKSVKKFNRKSNGETKIVGMVLKGQTYGSNCYRNLSCHMWDCFCCINQIINDTFVIIKRLG